ncbi:FAD-dependent monooxygenase [Pararhodobacter zhoushanensis]|uniref:FAD-dependent monooxygenase n=1 Tax=Pararhodobacter zhoushanensis TaxID=2479545 RepID=A0ABT3GZ94_9RHOB|nr:FAD-dependent monooxygenase [Pararhodobacter zhoushanensis]MCW1932866.1 FAD-dependent monooxygenase [Pararhodobacter zhoushanensis]
MTRVIISGAGIAGLVTALTLRQIGVACTVYDAAPELQRAGVGINLQPYAVRELYDLGIAGAQLNSVGLPLREWAMVSLNGKDISSEQRGIDAGFHWPQFSVDRGLFHAMLYRTAMQRLGRHCVVLGARITGYRQDRDSVTALFADGSEERGAILVAADGINSCVRAQMYPDQPPINRSKGVLWRGVTRSRPIRTGSSAIAVGTKDRRFVFFPFSHPGPDGLAKICWIAHLARGAQTVRPDGALFNPAQPVDIAKHFENFCTDWLDAGTLIRTADVAFETPMRDRDPVPTWRDGRVVLLGAAAHPMFPTGANSASQGIIDARVLGASIVEHGLSEWALDVYDDKLCAPISAVVESNRAEGPFELFSIIDARCGGSFDDIEEVCPRAERARYLARFVAITGFAADQLNKTPPIIAPGARASIA